MLNGINVLNTMVETNSTSSVGTLILGITTGLFMLFIMVILITQLYDRFKGDKIPEIGEFLGLGVAFLMLLIISTFTLESYFTRETYKTTKYQVTIDNTVKYNEFVNTYDILEHDGNVYIVKLKLEDSIKN